MYDPSNIGGFSQQNIGDSLSLPTLMSLIHPLSVDDLPMYKPQFSSSMSHIVGEDSPVEEVPTLKKKPSMRRQKSTTLNEEARCIP
ncbi:hypothetical protein Tco_0240656 [Tanacetum coccineum]